MMKNAHLLTGTLVGLVALTAQADLLTMTATSTVEFFGSTFDGADAFPFVGLQQGDAISFNYEFDSDTLASSNDGLLSLYEFDGAGSFVMLGGSTLTFDSVSLLVGTTALGDGIINFSGRNESLGITAGAQYSSNSPLSNTIPTSLDVNEFLKLRGYTVNTDANQLLLPVVFGDLPNGQIVPAPPAIPALLAGLAVAARRRR